MQTCSHCGAINVAAEAWAFDRCDECATHGHNHDIEMCLCQVANAPGIVGVVPMDVLVAVK